jgi:hypothetical protein
MFWFHLIAGLMVAASFQVMPLSSGQLSPKTVQISVDVDADVLIEDSTHRRIGVDLKNRTSVNEIPEARTIDREGSLTFVLPFNQSSKPFIVMLARKANTPDAANVSMTGPGFVVGVRKLNLTPGEVDLVGFAANGTTVSIVQSRSGPAPQLFLTSQSDRSKPSYRFEVVASTVSRGLPLTVELDLNAGRLNFKSAEPKPIGFTINMRRTNPDGSRDSYRHANVNISQINSYSVDFGKWDGKGEVCIYGGSNRNSPCTRLKNEAPATQPN